MERSTATSKRFSKRTGVWRLRGPLADDPTATVLHAALVGLLLWLAIYTAGFYPFIAVGRFTGVLLSISMAFVCLISLALLRRGLIRPAALVCTVGGWLIASTLIVISGRIHSPALAIYIAFPAAAVWLLGYRAALVSAGACAASVLVMAWLDTGGALWHLMDHLEIWSVFLLAAFIAAVPLTQVFRGLTDTMALTRQQLEELRRSEQALREQEGTYRTLFETAQEAILLADMQSARIVDANPAACTLYGYSRDEFLELGIFHLSDNPRTSLETFRAGAHHVPLNLHRKKDGTVFPVEITTGDYCVEGRDIHVGFIHDITDRRRAEEELCFANAYNRSLIEASLDPLVTIGPDGRITDVSRATEVATGHSREELVGTDFSNYFTESERAREGYQRVFREGVVRNYPLELRHRDGSVRSVLYNASTYRDEGGQVIGVFAAARDVTELKRAEQELRLLNESLEGRVEDRTRELEDARRAALSMMQDADFERRNTEELLNKLADSTSSLVLLWQAVENSPAVVVITDTEANIQYVNPKFSEVTGYSAEEVMGKNPRILKSGVHTADFYEHLWNTVKAGKTWFGEFCNRKKNGELYWEAASISPVRASDGQVRQFLAIKEDVTEIKRAAEELRLARDAAEAANRAKSVFLASMSHEIRTPLNAILGYSQLLLRDNSLDGKPRKSAEIINRSGEHLLALINDVIEVSKIEAGHVGLEHTEFDLRALLDDLASMFRLRATDKRLEFDVIIAEDLPRYVIADEGKTRQVLINLLGNAVKFTDEGRVAVLAYVRQMESDRLLLVVEVEDTGMGIAPEETGKLFRYFEQTRSGRLTQSGTGLGLVISREYARRMGGDITVASEVGRGSVFHFEVPIAWAADSSSTSTADSRRVVGFAPGQPRVRVLVVDDQETNRGWLSALLDAVGFEVREAEDGRGAVDIWQAWKPELVLMDMRMPVMDGFEATRRIREAPGGETAAIIAMTASTLEESRSAVMQAGADDLVCKPFREADLFDKIGSHLGVSFRYEDSEAPGKLPPGAPSPVTPALVAGLPAALRTRMKRAIGSCDMDSFVQMLRQVKEQNSVVASGLRALADRYDYDALARLLEESE